MQVSPVQTRFVIYRSVNIRPRLDDKGNTYPDIQATDFSWHGTRIETQTGCSAVEQTVGAAPMFSVILQVLIRNQVGNPCPYSVDVEIAGMFDVNDKLAAERREDLAIVNGLAILYSSARELVSTLTSRMEYGMLVLPGVNFQDQARATANEATGTKTPALDRDPAQAVE